MVDLKAIVYFLSPMILCQKLMKTAFAIAAHPDDVEFAMAGTLMLLRDAGYEIHLMNMTNGCCGTTEYDAATISRMRREEAMAAADYAGAVYHESFCDDLAIFYDKPTLARVAAVVREVAPEIVLTHSPADYMEDHMNASRLAVTAAFVRGMPNYVTDPPRSAVDGNVTVYHAQPYSHHDPLGQLVHPDMYIDVTDVLERKCEMLGRHTSQRQWLDDSQGLDCYLQTLKDLDRQCGDMSGKFQYAEGWRRHLHLGFCEKEDDPLRDALQDRTIMANH